MDKILSTITAILILFFSNSTPAIADDQSDALRAANAILTSIQQQKYNFLWDTQTSEFFKSKFTKESFLANMTIGRQQLGSAIKTKFIDMSYEQADPVTGYKGEIYAFNYLDTYALGKFYERVVVVKEKDGKFKLSGLWGGPVQKEK